MIARGIVGTRGDVPFVASPMHKNAFDLRTGRCLDDEATSVPGLRGAGGRGRGAGRPAEDAMTAVVTGLVVDAAAARTGPAAGTHGGRPYAGRAVRWRASAWGSPPPARSRS